jgi:uncharacterized membrane protein YagU involved in acid resistance
MKHSFFSERDEKEKRVDKIVIKVRLEGARQMTGRGNTPLGKKANQRALFGGTIGGFLAAAPMAVFMLAVQRLLPQGQQYALPPQRITDALTHRFGLNKHMNRRELRIAALVAHFIYSGAVGSFYQPLTRRITLPTVLRGTLFGIVVWFIGYVVLVPILNIPQSSSAQMQPLPGNLMMIATHIVWGTITGEIVLFLERHFHSKQMF